MCAIPKRVKVGGSYYKGYMLVVSATPGDYVLDMALSEACGVNGITIVPDGYGAGDYMKLEHLDANSKLVVGLGETIYNIGANSVTELDFAALQLMDRNHKFRLTYTNVAGVALNVYTLAERIK